MAGLQCSAHYRYLHETEKTGCAEAFGLQVHIGSARSREDISYLARGRSSRRSHRVYLREAIGETRRLAHGLSPVPFASDGLTSALKALVESVDGMGGVRAEFQCVEPVAFDESAVTEHLYRIVQEALNNALKHSSATLIRVTLCKRENSVEISIADNGIGLPQTRPEESGMGLRTVSYRANLVGGKLVATNGANGGAILTCTLPLAPSSVG